MVNRGAASSRIHLIVSPPVEILSITRAASSAASDTAMCRNEKCAVSSPPSAACAQLHCWSFLETKTWDSGSAVNSNSGGLG